MLFWKNTFPRVRRVKGAHEVGGERKYAFAELSHLVQYMETGRSFPALTKINVQLFSYLATIITVIDAESDQQIISIIFHTEFLHTFTHTCTPDK